MVIIHSARCLAYGSPWHPENPERVRSAASALRQGQHTWLKPEPCPAEDLLRVHSTEMVRDVQTGQFHDADTPAFPVIYELARLAAGAAILAAEEALAGKPAFSLMRPPGHHATRERPMGFCYFNNIAVAIAKMHAEHTGVERAAILDFDCHHGNGTEDIFAGDEHMLFVSLHQSPCYPGTGLLSEANSRNHPLEPGTGPEEFLMEFDRALAEVREFAPHLLAISAGFDAYRGDPITHMGLEIETYREIGGRIRQVCSERALPAFAVLEGGYSGDFAQCVTAFVRGWEQS